MIGLSARAIAGSADAAGYAVLAADFFGDLDLRHACASWMRMDGDLESGLRPDPVMAALETLAGGREPIGVVCGTGFEDRPELLKAVADRWPLLGSGAVAVRRVKEPRQLSALCRALGIPHPRWSDSRPAGGDWVSKRRGGAGGAHVGADGKSGADIYWQQRVDGEAVSVLVLGGGGDAQVLGLSAQWADPTPGSPYRYGGAVRPTGMDDSREDALAEAARAIVAAAGLVGLSSVDFLVGPDAWHLIEVNPRPGATLDIFGPDEGSLMALHIEACRGRLPEAQPRFGGSVAACTVYARADVACMPAIAWPDWTADRQPPGSRVEAGAPLCTVLARAAEPSAARRLVGERAAAIRIACGAG